MKNTTISDFEERYNKIVSSDQRNSGRSTKLADLYIDQLFTVGTVHVRDHYQGNKTIEVSANRSLLQAIIKRMVNEHTLRVFPSEGFEKSVNSSQVETFFYDFDECKIWKHKPSNGLKKR